MVDDSLVYRKIISRAVERTERAVVDCTASSGITALERLEQRSIDVVLMDVYMPGMDGIETLARIKEKYEDLPVIIISSGGVDGARLMVRALEEGAMDFILKPSQGSGEKNIETISRHLTICSPDLMTGMQQKPEETEEIRSQSGKRTGPCLYRDNHPSTGSSIGQRTDIPGRRFEFGLRTTCLSG